MGDVVTARVAEVKPDGKLDLSVREKAFIQMDADALIILERLRNMEESFRLPIKPIRTGSGKSSDSVKMLLSGQWADS